mmetsp:Transcript_68673/g.128118  ORF Transcript_68673/g.128118 Transcript_68673/m.128118 type:complete len:299 (+) Transcript_68673:64-960(+)
MQSWQGLSELLHRELASLERDGQAVDVQTTCKDLAKRAESTADALSTTRLTQEDCPRDDRVEAWTDILEARFQQLSGLLKELKDEDADFEWSRALCQREASLLKAAPAEVEEADNDAARDSHLQGSYDFDCSASYEQVIHSAARWTAHMKQERDLRALRDEQDATLLALQDELERSQQDGLDELSMHAAQAANIRGALQAGNRGAAASDALTEGEHCHSPRNVVLPQLPRTHRDQRPAATSQPPEEASSATLPQVSSPKGLSLIKSSRDVVSSGVTAGALHFWFVPSREEQAEAAREM